MKVGRKNEQLRIWFRSERVFPSGRDEWYFQTREGVDVGPYDSQFEAEVEAGLLKELLKQAPGGSAVMNIIRDFVLDSYAMGRPLNPNFRKHAAPTAAG